MLCSKRDVAAKLLVLSVLSCLVISVYIKGAGILRAVSNTAALRILMPTPQGRYWMLTIPTVHYPLVELKEPVVYIKGQKEIGAQGLEHWQLLAQTSRKVLRHD